MKIVKGTFWATIVASALMVVCCLGLPLLFIAVAAIGLTAVVQGFFLIGIPILIIVVAGIFLFRHRRGKSRGKNDPQCKC